MGYPYLRQLIRMPLHWSRQSWVAINSKQNKNTNVLILHSVVLSLLLFCHPVCAVNPGIQIILFSLFPLFQLCNELSKSCHFYHQRLKTYRNRHYFFFLFSNIQILSVFCCCFFRRAYWIKELYEQFWFAIPYKLICCSTKCENVKKIAPNLKASDCRERKTSNKPL